MYAIRLKTQILGAAIPKDAVLVISPNNRPNKGDIAVLPIEGDRVRIGILQSASGDHPCLNLPFKGESIDISTPELESMHRVVMIMMG